MQPETLTKWHDAKQDLNAAINVISYQSELLHNVGLEKIADRIDIKLEFIQTLINNMDNIISEDLHSSFTETRKQIGNTISTLLSTIDSA